MQAGLLERKIAVGLISASLVSPIVINELSESQCLKWKRRGAGARAPAIQQVLALHDRGGGVQMKNLPAQPGPPRP